MQIVQHMFANDPYSQWLGIQFLSIEKNKLVLSMSLREEMCNGFGIAHGGIAYALADSCLAFAANAHGKKAFSIETAIQHYKPVHKGDTLIAESKELSLTEDIAVYDVFVKVEQEPIAHFRGTVFRKGTWEV